MKTKHVNEEKVMTVEERNVLAILVAFFGCAIALHYVGTNDAPTIVKHILIVCRKNLTVGDAEKRPVVKKSRPRKNMFEVSNIRCLYCPRLLMVFEVEELCGICAGCDEHYNHSQDENADRCFFRQQLELNLSLSMC